MRPSRHPFGTPTFVFEIYQSSIFAIQDCYAIIFLLVLDLPAGKVLRGQVDRVVGSVDNIVELVQRLPWISVVYGSPCMVGSRIVRVKS